MIKTRISTALRAISAPSRSLAARIVLVLIAAFFVRAHALAQDSESARVYFPFDNSVVSAAYMQNTESLAALDRIAETLKAEGNGSLEVISYSSPEGNFEYNKGLSARRAAAVRDYIVSRHPSLAGRISLNPNAEAWDDLRASVEADTRMDAASRNAMLRIISSGKSADAKEAELKQLSAYKTFYSKYFRSFRYAEVRLAAGSVSGSSDNTGKVEGSGKASSPDAATVYYELNSSSINSGFGGNTTALESAAKILEGRSGDDFASITITASSSIDGPASANSRISKSRAESLRSWIEQKYPQYQGRITVKSAGEDWSELRENVVSDSKLDEDTRNRILGIIDSGAEADEKEAQLKKLSAWEYLKENILGRSRFAKLSCEPADNRSAGSQVLPVQDDTKLIPDSENVTKSEVKTEDSDADNQADNQKKDQQAIPEGTDKRADSEENTQGGQDAAGQDSAQQATEQPNEQANEESASDSLAVSKTAARTDSTAVNQIDSTAVNQIDSTSMRQSDSTKVKQYVPVLAVTTNLLYESATVLTGFHSTPLNIGLEIPIGKHFSAYTNYLATAPWRAWNNNADCAELINIDLGAKWYFTKKAENQILSGWYAYAGAGAGYYDFERSGKGYQGEHLFGTLGLGYGLPLGKHWSLDFAIGAGPLFSQYRYYEGRSNNQHLVYQVSGKMNYFGPTDAKVTLRYMFYRKK